jgi:chitodextrinase
MNSMLVSRDSRRLSVYRGALGLMAAALLTAPLVQAQVGFTPSFINGLGIGTSNNKASKVTSLQFGPDNRLYFLQVNGTVVACDVARLGPNNYQASNVEVITLVKDIPNYNDDGVRNPSVTGRQATGILVVGTPSHPVIYATSCDPREGAGSGGTDLNLDTNSGVISRLTRNGSGVWEKVDIVRGLPRSEENHACNGLTISADGNTLYLAQGGNTNAGSPSNNFAFSCETALAAAVLSIDLPAIDALPVQVDAYGQHYIYNIPTLNDPNPARADVVPADPDHADVNDPFGGNDGLNQAKIVPGGPVQVYATGFRNPYDVLISAIPGRVGKMYTFDNAGNSGWGGYPKNEAVPATVTNEYVPGEPGTVNNKDGLYLITGPGYYRGHPHPLRANPAGAGWLRNDEGGAGIQFSLNPTVDWPPVPVSMADPQQGDFKLPGPADGALITNSASTTGIAEYTAGNFGGAMTGDLIVTQYSSATVQRISLNAAGTAVTSSSVLLNGSNYGTPLDVTCPGPGAAPALTGTIFVGHHSSKITVLEPTDFDSGGGVCAGVFSFSLDEDGDGYSNADEISNNSDPCSPAVLPPDNDGDFLSDLLDADDDNDGIPDTQDLFAIDALNGRDVAPPVRRELFNELGIGFFSIGFKGVMLNPGENYAQKMDVDELIAGGTAGLFTDPQVGPGNPHGPANTQVNGFHFGVNVDEFTGPFLVSSRLGGLLFNGNPVADQSQGIFIGNGDQDNYLKVAAHANSGNGGIEVVHEENGTVLSQIVYPEPGLFSADTFLHFLVDPIAGTIHPGYALGNGSVTYVGSPIAVSGKLLGSIRGSTAMAFGLLATTGTVGTPTFNATWDYFDVEPVAKTAAASLVVSSGSGTTLNSSTNTTGSFKLENLSTAGEKITSLKIDVSTALLPDVVFDPDHTAGDHDGKAFEVDSFTGTGTPTHSFEAPKNGVDGDEGYQVIHVDCAGGVVFGPGDLLTFSSDTDPTSIRGVQGPGPFHSGSISGLELIGVTVTVTFDDGTVRKTRLGGMPGTPDVNKGSTGLLSSDRLPTPSISVAGQSSPFTTATQPTVRIAGTPGSAVKLGVFRSALRLDDGVISTTGYDLDPYETNRVESYSYIDETIGTAGFVDVPLSLSHDEEIGGIHLVTAFIADASGRSATSNVLTIDYDPTSSPATALFRVNAGSATSFTDAAGQVWAADVSTSTYGTTSGETSNYANPIAGTEDDALYQTFRYDGSPSSPLDFNFTVPNGTYEVRLHFAETWVEITAAGQRVFDVLAEGNTVFNDLDVFAEAGPNAALVKTFEASVNDGLLTIGLRHVVQNPFVCGIEIYQLSASGPDEEAPTPPAILTYSNLSPGGLLLAWSQAADNSGLVAGYRIYRDAIVEPIGTTTSGLSLAVTDLMPETEYEFAVEAFDAAGNVSTRTTLEVTTPADTQDPTAPGSLTGVAGNELAILSWTPSSDDTRVVEYRVFRDGDPVGTVTTPGFTDSGLTNGTLYAYSVVAVDALGKLSPPAGVSVRPRALGPAMYRVDCGRLSGDYTDLNGNIWTTDAGFNAGNNNVGPTPATTVPIAGTDAPDVYRNYRFKNRFSGTPLKYEFDVPNGEYELRLHFAELWSGATTPGARVFNVLVEGATALGNFDIYAQAGALNTALVKALPVTVADGKLTIDFTVVTQNPQVSGIEIFPLQEGPPDTTPPAAPSNLVVSSKTESTVTLAWDAPSDDAVAWVVQRGSETLAVVSSNSYADGGLLPDTAYSYSVTARDAANNLSEPSGVNVTTDPDSTPPGVPQNLTAAPGNGLVVLSWQAPAGEAVDHYDVFRDSVLVASVSAPGYTDTAVVNGTSYDYQVKAVDAAGNASAAASATGTPQALGPALFRINCGKLDTSYTDTLGNVWSTDAYYNASNGSTGSTTVVVSGTTAPDIYRTHRFKNRNSSTPLKYSLPVPNGSYEVRLHFAEVWTGATAPGIRVFDVLAEGSVVLDDFDIFAEAGGRNIAVVKAIPVIVSDSELTLDFTVVVQNPQICAIEVFPVVGGGSGDTVAPSTPADLAAANVTATGAELSWTASTDNPGGSGVEGYRIFRRETATQTIEQAQLIATVVGTAYADSGLTQGTDYEYRVFAYDAANNASEPAVLPVTTATPDTIPPAVPSDLAALPGPGQVELTWTASFDLGGSGVAGYRVFRDGDEIADIATPGHLDTGLFGNVSFVYEVLAYDAAGNESARAQVQATTPPDAEAPAAPRHLAALPGDASVALSWLPPVGSPDVTAYEVRRNGNLVATVGSTSYLDTGLSNGTAYTYQVRAVDTSGNDSPDVAASATPRVLGALVARVNAGGPAYTDGLGNEWSEDSGYFNLGQTSSAGAIAIAGTEDDVLYQTERYDSAPTGGDMMFATPVSNGKYEVKLHFAETFAGITAAGQRVFDVFAEEQLAIDDLDIFDRVGLNTALVVVLPVTVTDGTLNVRFAHLDLQNPKICAIEIHAVQPDGPPTFEEWLLLNNLDGQTSGDADAGGLSNLEEYELQLDPNDPADDLAFHLTCTPEAGGKRIALPVLKPIGNYHLHRSTGLDDLGNLVHRIDTITRAEIEAMSPEERATYTVLDSSGGERAFYQLFFEPVAD